MRQLKDRAELFADGGQALKFGPYAFTVNTQPLELTVVLRDGDLHYHLTGTNFFQKITDPAVLAARAVWDQTVVSENPTCTAPSTWPGCSPGAAQHPAPAHDGAPAVLSLAELSHLTAAELTTHVQQFMAPRYAEGYLKGVHDHDAALLLEALVRLTRTADLLRYSTEARAAAALYWHGFAGPKKKAAWQHQLQGIGVLLQVFPDSREFDGLKAELQLAVEEFAAGTGLFSRHASSGSRRLPILRADPRRNLHHCRRSRRPVPAVSAVAEGAECHGAVRNSVAVLADQPAAQFQLVRQWLQSFLQQIAQLAEPSAPEYSATECAVLLAHRCAIDAPARIIRTPLRETLTGLQGSHARIHERNYQLNFPEFRRRLHHYTHTVVPLFEAFGTLKKELLRRFTDELRLEEFRPRVLSSFVRNKLIDEVYLPLIGANLAKQIGTAGADKRTDLMGLLLLVSPPGYGKTTLMEYVANRLGLIFMKINGPAIGHAVTSVDPAQAPNSGAREELLKLNLAFEMGDNVMIYLDDIQHCNPEFLQKFISLCDAQRKIEGVYQGRARTYDFRGRKVAVVMAGNPYTESGEQFRIPDMLANRADIYNLGDIIGDTADAFLLSYLENALWPTPSSAASPPKARPTCTRSSRWPKPATAPASPSKPTTRPRKSTSTWPCCKSCCASATWWPA